MTTIARRFSPSLIRSLMLTNTRDKARIPAWCDRILRKGDSLKQIDYTTAPLRFSDHRPVYATFQCAVSAIDEARKEILGREIYARRRLEVGNTTANTRNNDLDDEDIIGYESIAPEFPPASSDRRKWWLDNGKVFLDPITVILMLLILWARTSSSVESQGPRGEICTQPRETPKSVHSHRSTRLDSE